MPHYAVTFVLKSDSDYADRYDSLMDQINAHPSKMVWSETTSFALVETTEGLETFADRIYFQSSVMSSKDKLVVIDHLNGNAVARGPIQYPNTLKSHFYSCLMK